MRTDAFGTAPAGNAAPPPNAPAPQPAGAPLANASPPVQNGSTPPSAPAVPPPAAPVAPPVTAPATNTTAPGAPAGKPVKADTKPAKKEPHMPAVGTVTKDNPTGAAQATPGAGDNSGALDEHLATLLAEAQQLGNTFGSGANSMAELALLICSAAKNGTISAGRGSEDVAVIFAKYREGMDAARLDKSADSIAEKNDKFHVSKLRAFANLGAADWKGNAPVFLGKAREFINEKIPRADRKSTYECLYSVASAQLKLVKADAKCKPMTQDAIKVLVSKPQGREDERSLPEFERDELDGVVKKLTKLLDGTDERAGAESDEVRRAIDVIRKRLLTLNSQLKKDDAEGKGDGEE